jgi:2-(1,2-epoxy-1,2-dihydrophenyl)acetyl-CoA isomerase
MTDPITSTLDDGVLRLTLSNPGARNAITQKIGTQLTERLRQAAEDPAVRVVVLTGAGEHFCSGADVKTLGNIDPDNALEARWGDDPIWKDLEQRTFRIRRNSDIGLLLHTMGKPTIAMVRGAAAGAGLSMAVACDFRIASDTAAFTTAFSRIGVSGDTGAGYFLLKLVGATRARELMFLSEKVTAQEALDIGLVSRVVPDAELEAQTFAFAAKLAQSAPIALRHIKNNLLAAERMSLEEALDIEAAHMARCFQTQDSKEAITAFREKRAPRFSGR